MVILMSLLAFLDAYFAIAISILIPITVADMMSIVIPAHDRCISS